MTPRVKLLRQTAAALRLKASTGAIAVSAARDASVIVPRELAAKLEADIRTGELAKRWDEAVTRARLAFPTETPDGEIHLAALADVLAWHGKQAARVAHDFSLRIEGDRRTLEGRAIGIEEALAAIMAAEPETDAELAPDEASAKQA